MSARGRRESPHPHPPPQGGEGERSLPRVVKGAAQSCRTSAGRVEILGVGLDPVRVGEALARLRDFARRDRPHLVCTVNVHDLMIARRDRQFLELYRQADLLVADGMPLVWASRWLGTPLPERVTGGELVEGCCRLSAAEGYRLYFLGAAPGIAARARETVEQAHPGVRVVGTDSPSAEELESSDRNAAVVTRIREAAPHFLLVALGSPKQEKWIWAHREALGVPVSMGIGSVLDRLAGVRRPAPAWMGAAGLEWLYRLVQEPGRLWRRYLWEDPRFFYFVWRQRTKKL